MEAKYNDRQGTFTVTMTRAEAHIVIWGAAAKAVTRVEADMAHALVMVEDTLTDEQYDKTVDEVLDLEAKLKRGGKR